MRKLKSQKAKARELKAKAKDFHRSPRPRPHQGLKNIFCVPTDELLRAKDDLLSEGGQVIFGQAVKF